MSKRICPIHGIWEKRSSKDRCPQCTKRWQKNYNNHSRDKNLTKFYASKEWRELRALKLKQDPLCARCGKAATVADHIIEVKDGGCKLCIDNLQSLCNGCHTVKSAEERKKRAEKKGDDHGFRF